MTFEDGVEMHIVEQTLSLMGFEVHVYEMGSSGQDQCDVVRTELGSRPGDGFADVVFGFLWGKLLRQLETELANLAILDHFPRERGLRQPIRPDDPPFIMEPFLGPTWMDDLCICISAPSNEALIHNMGITAGLLLDAGRRFQ